MFNGQVRIPTDINGDFPDATISVYSNVAQPFQLVLRGEDGTIEENESYYVIPGTNNICLDTIFDSFGKYVEGYTPNITDPIWMSLVVDDPNYNDVIPAVDLEGFGLGAVFSEHLPLWPNTNSSCFNRPPKMTDFVVFYEDTDPCAD